MSYYSFKNTLALAMNEGFRPWVKFGLTAFIEYDLRKYSKLKISEKEVLDPTQQSEYAVKNMQEHVADNSLIVGGVLSKEKGKYLKYRASGNFDLLKSDVSLEGEITTMWRFLDRDFSVKAKSYFEEHFATKYWFWDTSFKNTQRIFVGGEINFPELPFSKTRISGGYERLENYTYYNEKGLPAQGSSNIMSIKLDQQLKGGIFHWDNQVVYQKSTDEIVVPLPALSVYSNMYIMGKIAKVLTFQLGVDAHFHTEYYTPGYEPLTMQFYNQREKEYKNYLVATAYLNLHLKYTRFFVMMYNVTNEMGDFEPFSFHRYPVNPRILKLGLSWQFNN